MKNYYIIDFDSTFTQVEALDELARISLENHPDQEKIYNEIERFTNLAMEGKISFRESLAGRVSLLQANRQHLDKLIAHLKRKFPNLSVETKTSLGRIQTPLGSFPVGSRNLLPL